MPKKEFVAWLRKTPERSQSFTVSPGGTISFKPEKVLRSAAATKHVHAMALRARRSSN